MHEVPALPRAAVQWESSVFPWGALGDGRTLQFLSTRADLFPGLLN